MGVEVPIGGGEGAKRWSDVGYCGRLGMGSRVGWGGRGSGMVAGQGEEAASPRWERRLGRVGRANWLKL